MEDIVPKNKLTKTFIPHKGQVSKPPLKKWAGKDRLDEET
jgi:hypothetical protein